MIYKQFISRVFLLLTVVAFALPAAAQEGGQVNLDEGKTLFRNYCATCHNKNMVDNLTGPALGGVEERWADYPREDLYKWIRQSQAMISEGHPKAVELWAEWKPTVMNNFLNLTDQEIENVLGYIDAVYKGELGPKKPAGDEAGVQAVAEKPNNTPLFIALAVILGILAIVLARIVSNLNYMMQVREGNENARKKSLVETLTSKGLIAFVVFALVVLGGYTTVNNAIMLGRQQGYEPEQPIKFSHATHAGLQKIDCQYCHDGARRSKHSVIPAANTCMNCHRAIKVGSKYGTAELTKIYASIGYDPSTDSYINDYEEMSQGEVEKIYKKWIADTYVKENGSIDSKGEELIEDQWDGIVSSLTNETKPKVQGPIEWVRIHNLPDHAYFNHAQHVTVGQLECQTCHGPVEEMEVVKQHSPLSMGWCINCHRQTEVKFEDNEYYKSYTRYHEEIAKGEREKVTVEDIGGLECQKCHY
ncbi:c-type cytochrome [Phaeodactylibacter luteus]|uniref:C-type cytochrome n=1 Tax=Phaeodactylibacter luteus TaxID=1564516 RepID=A0A5C6RKQ2_9BACT|nr:c-type cytochrome [Phaeodactylibacter luteus]TXB62958.1 c-type cytochrome [Phaeodactylibacter luteus]